MRVIQEISLSNLIMDRYPITPDTLALVKYLESGGTVPPIKVAKNRQGNFVIKDGRHRVTAFKLLGRKFILAKFSTEKERV